MDKYMTELQLTESEQSFMQATERKNLKSAQCLIEIYKHRDLPVIG